MSPFAFATAARIAFGAGEGPRALEALAALGRRPLLVTGRDPARAAWLRDGLAARGAAVATVSAQGEPSVEDAMAAVDAARDHGADAVVGLGGGAALDLAKAAAGLMRAADPMDHLEVVGRGLPLAADPPPLALLPTTAGTGAEVTRNAVLGAPAQRRKVSLRDARLLPRLAVVDPELLIGLPPAVALASGLDALVQVIEPLVSSRATPLTDALCREALPRGLRALPRLLEGAGDAAARADMAFCALSGGLALANAGLGAVHGLAGPLGGRTAAAHGAICGRLAPAVLTLTEAALPADHPVAARFGWIRGEIAAAWGGAPAAAWEIWARRAAALPPIGLAEDPLDVARAAAASSSMKAAPVALEAAALAQAVADSDRLQA